MIRPNQHFHRMEAWAGSGPRDAILGNTQRIITRTLVYFAGFLQTQGAEVVEIMERTGGIREA